MIRSIQWVIFSLPLLMATESFVGEVTAIYDGNTIEVSTKDKGVYRVVLMGIDCPELSQAYGNEAKDFLAQWLLHREVLVRIHGKDRARNYVGVVLMDEGQDVRLALLQEGLAWTSERDAIPELEMIRLEAVRDKKGLWNDEAAVAPWIFRRQQTMLEAKSR
ncbi:MAG TPA: thermonuclease family protein [Chryseosolibacter sp.]|nr:thermonuclease family protein [Chryseosolibacter sp.]